MNFPRAFIISGMLMATAPANAEVRGEFACEVRRSVTHTDGALVPSPDFETRKRNRLHRFTFSENTGDFRWLGMDLQISYAVKQYGSTVNPIVAAALKQGPRSYSVKTLRIDSWSPLRNGGELLYPFMLVDEGSVETGLCRLVP